MPGNPRRPSVLAPIGANVQDSVGIVPQWQQWFSFVSDNFPLMYKYDVEVDVTSVAANTTSEQTVTVSGVASNDFVFVSKPSHSTGLGIVNVRASAQDTVAITFMNTTGSAIDPGSETYTFLVIKV